MACVWRRRWKSLLAGGAAPSTGGMSGSSDIADNQVDEGESSSEGSAGSSGLSVGLGFLARGERLGFGGSAGCSGSAASAGASAGAACHSDTVQISDVLKAMKVPLEWAKGTLRLTTGRMTTAADIDKAVRVIATAVKKLRS